MRVYCMGLLLTLILILMSGYLAASPITYACAKATAKLLQVCSLAGTAQFSQKDHLKALSDEWHCFGYHLLQCQDFDFCIRASKLGYSFQSLAQLVNSVAYSGFSIASTCKDIFFDKITESSNEHLDSIEDLKGARDGLYATAVVTGVTATCLAVYGISKVCSRYRRSSASYRPSRREMSNGESGISEACFD